MGLNGIDLAVIVGYLAAVTFVGLRFRSPEKNREGLLSYQRSRSLVGDRPVDCGCGNQYSYYHKCSRACVRARFPLPAICDRIHDRTGDRRFPSCSSLFSRRACNRISTHRTSFRRASAAGDGGVVSGHAGCRARRAGACGCHRGPHLTTLQSSPRAFRDSFECRFL